MRPLKLTLWINLAIIVFATALGLLKTGNPSRYFGEGRFTTAISCFQLLLTAVFAFRILRARRTTVAVHGEWKLGPWLWGAIAFGFVFLAADDAFRLHERMDRRIHRVFELQNNLLTDHIDDAIIALYGCIGLGVLWAFRREMLAFKVMVRPLAVGFAFGAGSVICDTLASRADLFYRATGSQATAKALDGWFSVGDGAFTLLAEGAFAAAFYIGMNSAHAAQAGILRRVPSASAKA